MLKFVLYRSTTNINYWYQNMQMNKKPHHADINQPLILEEFTILVNLINV